MNIETNKPIVYLITAGTATAANFKDEKPRILEIIARAVRQKIPLVQIREKKLSARQIYEIAVAAVSITKNSATKILINDRADIALAADAGGVHLTANSITAAVIRSNFPPDFIIGVSTHSIEKAALAKKQKADFVTFSPIFDSPHKPAVQGIEKLVEICKNLAPFPVIALGGIDETNYKSVLASGADGFAAIRFLHHRLLADEPIFKENE